MFLLLDEWILNRTLSLKTTRPVYDEILYSFLPPNPYTTVPEVVKICTEFIETHGVVDGIYRLSGVTSNIQYLRDMFDGELMPDLVPYEKDIHCMTSVCKLYFRELPNPLLTYQLYKKFEVCAGYLICVVLPSSMYRYHHYFIRHILRFWHKNGKRFFCSLFSQSLSK